MRRRVRNFRVAALAAFTAALACIAALAPRAAAQSSIHLLPLEITDDGRRLQRANGTPFFWMGDTAWSLQRLSPQQLDVYFTNRRLKGFNVIQGPNMFGNGPNFAGVENADPQQPSEAWFEHIDLIIERAAEHGLYIAPVLAWGVHASQFTTQTARAYGELIGLRYHNATNIAAFIVAGEFNYPDSNTHIWNAMAEGLIDGLGGAQTRLITAHPRWFGIWGGQTTSEDLHNFPWLSFNMLQSSIYGNCTNDPTHLYYLGTHNWLLIENDWNLKPVKPVFDGEGTYEGQIVDHPDCTVPGPFRWDAFGVRRRAYWSIFAGGFGHTYGANGVFQFYMPGDTNPVWAPELFWTLAMEYPGATSMTHLRRLMQSRPLEQRIPAQDLLLFNPGPNVPSHMHATRDADGRWAMVYSPRTNAAITVDMDLVDGAAHDLWWFNPGDGTATHIGQFTHANYGGAAGEAAFTLTTPATGEDWVLVIDDAAQDFVTPGSAPLEQPGDINRDGLVNVSDLLAVISAWGPCQPAPRPCLPDATGDGAVGVGDLLVVVSNWG